MVLERMTWQEVRDLSRDVVVLVPTGSIEQHGPHLPLCTDTLLASHVAARAEQALPGQVLLTPAVWLGASAHHLAFAGTLSASFEGYDLALAAVFDSLAREGFWKFFVVNGHGGNAAPNDIACRRLKAGREEVVVGHAMYSDFVGPEVFEQAMRGPVRSIRHACEAETSMVMHVAPDLVRTGRLRDDGLADPSLKGLAWNFDEVSEEGSYGYATLADPETGRAILEAAVEGLTAQLKAMAEGVSLQSLPPNPVR
ncbi:MAG: creatininase family protein [Fimbriimonadaceae bacterium]|nr:creatininase family protein [Fimbriimonadaceae bacterium]QYK56152.1 MAG: creatininase family protein [Fimbriimonadaceae bacterium]